MKKLLSLTGLSALVVAVSLTGCGFNGNSSKNTATNSESSTNSTKFQVTELPQIDGVKSGDTIATIKTNMGDIKVWFFPEYAPKAVENFTTHAKEGYYNNLIFHRVINDFMIQGGDPEGTGTGGESIWGADFENETTPNLRSFRGALCMANAGADTNGSQFYIVQAKDVSSIKSQIESSYDQVIDEDGNKMSDLYPENVLEAYEKLGGYPSLDFGYTIFGQVYDGMDIVDKIAAVQTDENDKPVDSVVITGIEVGTY
ncbi:MAG: peptidylprolyl isomerase [Lachnospirales bacterium]